MRVRPQAIAQAAEQAAGAPGGELLIGAAAGAPVARPGAPFGPTGIVRTMPAAPPPSGLGATGVFANGHVDMAQIARAPSIVEAFGICIALPRQALPDKVAGVPCSGPACVHLR